MLSSVALYSDKAAHTHCTGSTNVEVQVQLAMAVTTVQLYADTKHCTLYTLHYSRYLALLARATPIESSFIKALPDHLNAEVVAGTVTSVKEAVAWLGYTYLHVRMQKNPMAYGTHAHTSYFA
jgi:hypothetical protein